MQLAPDNKLYRCQHAIISRRLGHWDRAFSDYTVMRGLGKCISPASSPTHSTASGVKRTEIAETVRRIPRDDHTSLSDFRVTINHLTDIHDALFLQPSKAQAALSTPPAMRDTACIQRLSEVMATFRIFSDVSPAHIKQLAAVVKYHRLKKRDVALAYGEEADACCVVLSGCVSMRLQSAYGAHVVIEYLSAGDMFGDSTLLASRPICREHKNERIFKSSKRKVCPFAIIDPASAESANSETELNIQRRPCRLSHQESGFISSEAYHAEAPSEILVIPRSGFDGVLRSIAYKNLQRRFSLLKRFVSFFV